MYTCIRQPETKLYPGSHTLIIQVNTPFLWHSWTNII